MKNITGNGEKLPEILKIMPTVALALMLNLSACRETEEKKPISMWDATIDLHSDYFVEEKPCQDTASFAWCTEKRVILKDGGHIYVRSDVDSNGAPVFYIGSYDENDTIESEMWNSVLEIQNQ